MRGHGISGKSGVLWRGGDSGGRRFFFSSRRRHTRFDCDWSSDVCSSDLDQGRSTALLTTTWPILLARISCGTGGKPIRASSLPSARRRIASAGGGGMKLMAFPGARPPYAPLVAAKRGGGGARAGPATGRPLG